MVNKANVMRLAKAFATKELATRETDRIGYNQELWEASKLHDFSGHECGTTACVAGWAIHLLAPDRIDEARAYGSYGPIAQDLLGLDDYQRQVLFSAGANPNAHRRLKDGAVATCTVAAVLKNLAHTGEVNWRKAAKEAMEANGE